ncbi:hypothetical protein Bb109J_c3489 [Bdellovibrio bacteriovorus]|uniref:transglycosylase SLT domain-containing protein n=1 Tax=Bdellovibrio bacteriovorus TaxID=959 RepID=UPI00045BE298|nr:transglycosylase SLT domain-containing protein [Bdellovibrio bacteriovorus]AHZ85522.1 hypothetical protein EP01_11330 [Bdellovibrio bacteriovorus]BEV70069.1 hypothetical protein Bb109J_c3489 [Bdellovibrio bacteriovorus]
MKRQSAFVVLVVCVLAFATPDTSYGMAKTINFLSAAGSKIADLFGKAKGAFSSCTNCESGYDGPKPPDSEGLPKWSLHPQGGVWTQYTLDAIDKEGLANLQPKDAKNYCPNWDKLTLVQRRHFWLVLVAKLAEIESSFQPTRSYKETKGRSEGTTSNGLLQMSVHQCSYLKKEADTFDPKKNLSCGVELMKTLVSETGQIGTGGNSGLCGNWQPFCENVRYHREETKANKAALLRTTRAIPFCRIGYVEPILNPTSVSTATPSPTATPAAGAAEGAK